MRQICQTAQRGRHISGQLVLRDGQSDKIGETANFRRDFSAQLVARQVEVLQIGEAANLRRNLARQAVFVKMHADDAPIVICLDAAPLADWVFA